MRDNYTSDVERVVVDSRAEYDRIRNFMNDFMPQHKNKVHYYKGKAPAFDVYGVEAKIHQSLGRKVWLKSGGYLVIDQTEALTAIDVNSGKFVGKSSLEETTTQLNLEAVEEVVYHSACETSGHHHH